MSRRIAAGLLGLAAALSPSVSHADEGDKETTRASADELTGRVAASAGVQSRGGLSATGSAISQPRCTWEKFVFNVLEGGGPEADSFLVRDSSTKALVDMPAQNTETMYRRLCPGEQPAYTWVADGVDEQDLVSSAFSQVTAQVPSPSMNMNPEPNIGGIVNIGLWLAVHDPGQVSITASVGPVWATVTARYVRTVWSMGNSDVVECDGLGTPIWDLDTAEQGPCGYTYRWPSAPKFTGTDDLAYHASVTGEWVVTYLTSSGRSGSLAPITRSTDFSYQVREIQTLRVAEPP